MTESNIEEIIKNHNINNKNPNNTKQSILNTYPIFIEYENEDLLYPICELDKWKRKLQMIRTRMINKFKDSHPPLRRPMNSKPLQEVFQDLMDKKSSSTNLDNENVVERYEMIAKLESHQRNSSKTNVQYVYNNNTKIYHNLSSNPTNVDKTNQIIDRDCNGAITDGSIATKNSKSKLKITSTSTKRTQPLKKKARII